MRDIVATSPTLLVEPASMAMCRFTLAPLGLGASCAARAGRLHRDMECWALFVVDEQATAQLLAGELAN